MDACRKYEESIKIDLHANRREVKLEKQLRRNEIKQVSILMECCSSYSCPPKPDTFSVSSKLYVRPELVQLFYEIHSLLNQYATGNLYHYSTGFYSDQVHPNLACFTLHKSGFSGKILTSAQMQFNWYFTSTICIFIRICTLKGYSDCQRLCTQQQNNITTRKAYLGLGTLSSGTGVHVESGDFCSLNLPVNTLAMSSMS